MKLAIVGCRDYHHYAFVEKYILESFGASQLRLIITGDATGVDALARRFAAKYNIAKLVKKAQWKKFGKAAGPIRNRLIVVECNAMVAFWDGESPGTRDAISWAKRSPRVKLTVVYIFWFSNMSDIPQGAIVGFVSHPEKRLIQTWVEDRGEQVAVDRVFDTTEEFLVYRAQLLEEMDRRCSNRNLLQTTGDGVGDAVGANVLAQDASETITLGSDNPSSSATA